MKKQLFLGDKPVKELMQPVQNAQFVKANGGLWTSTYKNGKSDWINWCESNNFWTTDNQTKWLLSVNKNARVLKIDTRDDLFSAYKKYGISLLGGDFELAGYKIGITDLGILDYEKIARDYDGVWLTQEGQWATRFSSPISLYGWDCECTHWFRWVFDKVERVD